MPRKVTSHSGVTEHHHVGGNTVVGVDPGWSRDCLLMLPVTTEQSTTGPEFTIQVSGCYCLSSNKGVPEVAKLAAMTALMPNADYDATDG